jgi:hypothetical protein
MVIVKYEDMSMTQLKSLCRDKGLGTGRSKQELVDKLLAYDNRKPNEPDVVEDQVTQDMEKNDTDDPDPEVQVNNSGTKLFSVSFPHVGPLLDSEHDDYRLRTRHLARESGLEPFGRGLYSARLDKVENGFLYYEIEVR